MYCCSSSSFLLYCSVGSNSVSLYCSVGSVRVLLYCSVGSVNVLLYCSVGSVSVLLYCSVGSVSVLLSEIFRVRQTIIQGTFCPEIEYSPSHCARTILSERKSSSPVGPAKTP
jgi:hypothetical protein